MNRTDVYAALCKLLEAANAADLAHVHKQLSRELQCLERLYPETIPEEITFQGLDVLCFERIHGYPVVSSSRVPRGSMTRPGRVVVVLRPGHVTPYVVAWQGFDVETGAWDSEWDSGVYLATEDAALAAFEERCQRHR